MSVIAREKRKAKKILPAEVYEIVLMYLEGHRDTKRAHKKILRSINSPIYIHFTFIPFDIQLYTYRRKKQWIIKKIRQLSELQRRSEDQLELSDWNAVMAKELETEEGFRLVTYKRSEYKYYIQ